MRREYDSAMNDLADSQNQAATWHGPCFQYDLAIHIIFDDMSIDGDQEMAAVMGLTEGQQRASLAVMSEIKKLWNEFGTEAEISLLRAQPGWKIVMAEAQNYLDAADPEHVKERRELPKQAPASDQ